MPKKKPIKKAQKIKKKTIAKKTKTKSNKALKKKKTSTIVPKKLVNKTKTFRKAAKKAAASRIVGSKKKTAFKTLRKPKKIGISIEEIITKAAIKEKPPEERRVEESKFDIGVSLNAEALPLYDVPYEYKVDRAVLLTVDPSFVFTYWEVRPESMYKAIAHLGPNAKLTLRFYDITSSNNLETSPSWDIEVFDRLGNWYLKLDYPEQRLCLDVGLKNEFGIFYNIARSNIIKLPRQSLAKPGPFRWMIVSPDGQKITTDVEEYTEADLELLRKILGPYFFDLLMKGQFASIAGSSLEAVFQEISTFRIPMEVSSSPSSWSEHPR